MGRLHARVFGELSRRFDVKGYVDPVVEYERQVGFVRFASAQDLFAAVDAVVIAAPPSVHLPLACVALDACKVVLVEKPLAPTLAEARRAAARDVENRLFVGHSERFNPVVRALRQRLSSQRVESLTIERFVPTAEAGDVLANLGVHDFDLVEHLTGERAAIVAAEGDESSSAVRLVCGDASATLACGRRGDRKRRIRILTDRETLEGDLLQPTLVRIDRATGARHLIELTTEEPLRAQAQALHEAVAFGVSSALASAAAGARAVELAERAIVLRNRMSRASDDALHARSPDLQ